MTLTNDELFHAVKIFLYDEGKSNSPYRDTKGYWTIGVGHFIGDTIEALKLSDNTILSMLREDIKIAYEETISIFGTQFLGSINAPRKMAILTLVFTLGRAKLLTFHQTVPAIKEKRWADAAGLLLKTKWAEDVDPKKYPGKGRDDRIAFMLLTGEFHEDYKISPA